MWYMITFILGGIFGVITMCCVIVGSDADK